MVYRPVRPLAAALLLLAASLPGRAATILEKSVDVEIQPDGSTVERTALRVRVDTQADFAAWSPYAIYFDDHRTIEDVTASVATPDGETVRLDARDFGTVDLAGEGKHRSSSKARTVRFPAVSPGSVLAVGFTARQRLDFRADGISLAAEKAPIERLRVAVRGGGKGWRWRIAGSRAGLTVQENEGGVAVTGASLPVWKKEGFAPGDRSRGPVLRYAWGQEATWAQVGQWYEGLTGSIPADSAEIRNAVRKVTAGREDRRGRLASLLGFVRGKLRYVAAESGIDGHRPTAPREVLERGWGDCKDKSLLLVALLREAGIDAWPALIRLGSGDRIDAEFPSPFQFNHVIVAVAAEGVAALDDPVAGGLLFVDPTQDGSSIRWLHPAVQDQDALVVRGAGSALVHTPLRQDLEGGKIDTRLTLTAEGDARGEVSFQISGDAGASLASAFKGSTAQEVEPSVRQIFGQLLPAGAELSQVRWTIADTSEAEVPSVTLSAQVHLPAMAQGDGSSHSFGLPPMAGTPKPAVLRGRELPVVLTPKSNRFSWKIEIPAGWCPPRPETVEVGNAVGTFRQSVAPHGQVIEIGRELEIRQRWIEPARFADLEALSMADHKANQQLFRMDCGAAAAGAAR
jgi:hypothetical protein